MLKNRDAKTYECKNVDACKMKYGCKKITFWLLF